MSEWQPIETAPRDQYVLLFGRQLPHDMLRVEGDLILAGYWSDLDEAWCCIGSLWNGPFYKPTHWRPLPEPPAA